MRKKSFAATITIIFCAIFVSVIGATFSTYMLRKNIIKIDDPTVYAKNNIVVYDEKDNKINKLKLSDMKLGLKPATGEEDVESEIPTTVTSSVGSEGYYSKFKLTSSGGFKIIISNVHIKPRNKGVTLDGERENIKVALEDIKGSSKNLVGDNIDLFSSDTGATKKSFTLLVWLTPKAGQELKGATISFDVIVE